LGLGVVHSFETSFLFNPYLYVFYFTISLDDVESLTLPLTLMIKHFLHVNCPELKHPWMVQELSNTEGVRCDHSYLVLEYFLAHLIWGVVIHLYLTFLYPTTIKTFGRCPSMYLFLGRLYIHEFLHICTWLVSSDPIPFG